jgi:hypothetical protein
MVEVQGDGSVDGGLVHLSFGANATDLGLTFVKTRGLTPSANGIVAADDIIGSLNWFANDGTGTQFAAIVEANVDGSPAAGSMPARLGFYTTPSGTVSPVERLRIDNAGFTQIRSGTFGLATGQGLGGAVTQVTSRTTAVTLNKISGAITLLAGAPTVGTWVTFTVNNSLVAANDAVIVNVQSATDTYVAAVSAVAAGSFKISFMSISGTTSDSPVVNFTVIKGTNN